ncbi:MAG: peptidoglycan DD-metalloendopeptidase family protein [Gammaproteobacteria bacterium]|nr:peptidoglycan DD-metalloendopeptidase family protein [Gammaproteobacteria bacterium]
MNSRLKSCVAILFAAGLTACGTFPLPPVSEQGKALRQPEAEYRVVQPGDTLYSIAWESGRDYQDVARWNHISSPYLIQPGQRLRLFPPAGTEKTSRPEPGSPVKSDSQKKTAPNKSEPVTPARRAPAVAASQLSWAWPTRGELLERYSANGPNKGIDIAGKKGQPILAAEAGQVVYQGGGLRGYGQLIIVKHNADFLSAYAHCDKISVKEGNVIKRGQKIADMGSSGTDRTKLHFEVRYRGAPVDPQDYLPKK